MSETASKRLPYNKACGLEDFADPEMVAVLRDVYGHEAERDASYPAGAERRKHWEVAMSVRALRDFGALRPDAEILGVGAGSEITLFHLTRHARRVVATDLYLAPGVWEREAHPLMMVAPERLSPIPFERERLEVLHMDGRRLRFPDGSFDGIFSSGSIEHFGGVEDFAAAAYEMGRVLKPGGILTLSTELLLEGPPGAVGWPGVWLFSLEGLQRHLIEASGLEPVDALDLTVSPRTLATVRPLVEMIAEVESGRETFPHLILTHDGQAFGSVHLALRKTERYPVPDNAWARPSAELHARVQRSEAEAEKRLFGAPAPVEAPAAPPPPAGESTGAALLEEAFLGWDAVRSRSSLQAPEPSVVRRGVGFLRRTALRVRDLGVSWELQRNLFRMLIDRDAEVERRLTGLEAAVAGLKSSEADILGALDKVWNLQGGAESGDSANLRDRHEILRVRQTRLEGALADLREELAALSGGPSMPSLPLTQREVAEILATVDTDAPFAGAVEISFQDARAESLLLAARRHFGGRLSSSASPYRGPNDLWIHVDFTPHWNRQVLLENAAARLAPAGRFVLITAPAAGDPPAHGALELEEDRKVVLAAGGEVRALIWRKS